MEYRLSRRIFMKNAVLSVSAASLSGTIFRSNILGADKSVVYQSSWESLDAHPCPEWFHDAKLGMYFHWGVCSVPAWAPRKEGISYAEWYWYNMNDRNNPTWQYHRDTYGVQFTYDDFIPLFRAERYDPGEWVAFAKQVGMRYIFVNAKHHDGFCLWPSRYTDRNAYKMGPGLDLIGPLVAAARRENLRVGFYYSFYEWYNPVYTGKPLPYAGLIPVNDYVDDFMIPQIRELIDLYHPDFMYFDGEWDHPPEFWKSMDVVARYYNQARERGQQVLVNDRFGNGSRGKHGDVYNVEYHYGIESEGLLTHKWSYWRGVGNTYGYNRDMNPEDCLTVKELIDMVVNGVSRNGNFDINVGPTAEGVISDVEREPLIALGRWLEVNGEAVYGTRPWRNTHEGYIRFTAKGDYIYAIFLKWQGESFRIASVQPVDGSQVTMLGVDGPLAWRRDGSGIIIDYPLSKPRPARCTYAWAFKIRVKGN